MKPAGRSLLIKILVSCFLFFPFRAIGMELLPEDMHVHALGSIADVYGEDFKEAEEKAKYIMKKYPDHPSGYFFCAAVLYFYMSFLMSNDKQEQFYRYCDLAIHKGEALLKKEHNNLWAKFFIAGAYGFKGKYESDDEKWVTSFKHGWQGVVLFKEIIEKDTGMRDAYFGIATYNYWRSAKTKLLWWMPGVEDNRGQSIRQLFSLQENGIYTRENALFFLIDILLNEGRYTEAVDAANKLLQRYPGNLLCWWGKVKAELLLEEYAAAEESLHHILRRVEESPFENNNNAAVAHYYMSKIAFASKQYEKCLKEATLMRILKMTPRDQKRLERYFLDVEKMNKEVAKILKK